MNERPVISLGDVVRACSVLEVDDERTAQMVAERLGLSFDAPIDVDPEELRSPIDEAAPASEVPADREARLEPEDQSGPEQQTVPSELVRLRSDGSRSPRRKFDVDALEAPTSGPSAPRDPEPLFVARWTRGILGAALATMDEGVIDLERAIDLVARLEPLTRLPIRPRPTLRNGVQVLLDRSEAMLPFYRDQASLARSLEGLIGPDRLTVQRFAGCPTRGTGTRTPRTWTHYEPPRPRTPVLVVTHFGAIDAPLASDVASTAEWHAFASDVAAAGCPLVAIVPCAPARLPAGLPQAMRLVVWDRSTTARAAQRDAARRTRAHS